MSKTMEQQAFEAALEDNEDAIGAVLEKMLPNERMALAGAGLHLGKYVLQWIERDNNAQRLKTK